MRISMTFVAGLGLMCVIGVEAKKSKAPSLKQPIQYCDIAKIKDALDKGGDPNEKDAGVPMFLIAARAGNCEILKLLAARGAVVEATNLNGMTALCALSIDSKEPDELVKANIEGNKAVIEAFKKRGNEAAAKDWLMPTDPSIYSSVSDRAKTLVELGANPNFVWGLEMTPFLQAVKSRNIPLVKALLATGKVDPELRFHQWADKIVWMASTLDVNDFQKKDQNTFKEWEKVPMYDTPLLYAIDKGDLELVQVLVDGGANVNNGKKIESKNRSKNVVIYWVIGPLAVAEKKGNAEIIEFLKSKGATSYTPPDVVD